MPRFDVSKSWLPAALVTGSVLVIGTLLLNTLNRPGTALFFTAVLSGLLLGLLHAVHRTRQWASPARNMADTAERMATGQWQERAQSAGAVELRDLTARLNLLADAAQQQMANLQDQRQDLQSLVDTLPDPVLAIDGRQRIELINRPAARLLDVTPAQVMDKKLVAVVNDEAVLALFDKPADPSRQREIRLMRDGQRITFQAVLAPTTNKGTLLLMRNVTTLSAMMQMKTDFVANASHELRTPIAAIKIAFDTLRDVYIDDPEQAQRCIQIIEGHLKRLEEMLSDLLDLSRVENAREPSLRPIRGSDLFTTIRSTMGPLAAQKQVALHYEDRNPDGTHFHSDESLLNLVLRNLVENAIKFTPTGGKVTAFIATTDDATNPMVQIGVTDTGKGIPPEHLERVFERFYQVDAARSGTAGRGTGLGLAIVKHAINSLGGTVQLTSKVGQGTTIICTLPWRSPDASSLDA